jgi:hypothetical protein
VSTFPARLGRRPIYRGDTWTRTFRIESPAGTPYNLAAFPNTRCQFRQSVDGPVLTEAAVVRSGAELNVFAVTLTSTQTAALTPGDRIVADVEVFDNAGTPVVVTVAEWSCPVLADVSRG